jgi:hypothetical protein
VSTKTTNKQEDFYIECPHCQVCSIKISVDEFNLVKSGQQMVEVCQICGREVVVNDCRALC